ncbi:MAG TPA: hypothetical protein VJM32_01820 [Candidatus Saccharimonadales bacterium]|nr:hypothetical protein [Candidatus Saccharimonadales bacterium]
MTETTLLTPEHTAAHHAWDMETRTGGFEQLDDIRFELQRSAVVLNDFETATEGPVIGFVYDTEQYDTHREYSDEYGTYDVEVSLAEFMQDDPYDERRDTSRVQSEIKADIAEKAVDLFVPKQAWWLDTAELGEYVDVRTLDFNKPTEQLIIGQEGRGVRFFNYGEAMSAESREDCRLFIDLATQYFGDRVYDILSDVVVMPFDQQKMRTEQGKQEDEGYDTDGFVSPGFSGVIFVDSAVMREGRASHGRLDDGVSRLLEVLMHEFGHVLHGHDEEAKRNLLEFASKVGWNVDAMHADNPSGAPFQDKEPFAPNYDFVVTHKDGRTERLSPEEYSDKYETFDDDGNPVGESPDYYYAGSPTTYGEKSPEETFAETTSQTILGNFVVSHMPETRDAWLEHAHNRILKPGETRDDRPLAAVPVNRAPIDADHRTGDDILFPTVQVPKKIFVRAKATSQPAVA